ncbi:YncE family protein [Tunturiibacter gelidoferens]|uniref:NHL repeat-containing protein n=1 Tax=Tunturiibacter gelidiferens TaxID=3069689 RepID=A0AAU7YXJ6_9BACT
MRIYESFSHRETDAPLLRQGSRSGWSKTLTAVTLLACGTGVVLAQHHDSDDAFLPSPVRSVSTVPGNGDVNPYGVAFVGDNFQTGSGPLKHGDILVSNFNNSMNLQGTGTTIVRVPKSGSPTVFFQGKVPLGLSTALGTLQYGFVVVGNAPTVDGTAATAGPGSLLVINNQGKLIQTFTSVEIQGPWDMALVDCGDTAIAFVSNDLTGTVVRLDFKVSSSGLTLQRTKTIASGYVHRGDPVTLFVSPTGLVYDDRRDVLYVASTGDNAVFAVRDAADRHTDGGLGTIVYQDNVHLHGALGLAMAPNGHLLLTNNDGINPDPNQPSEIVEFTKDGRFVKQIPVDPAQGGSFGLAVRTTEDKAILAAVDDNTATLTIWTLNFE